MVKTGTSILWEYLMAILTIFKLLLITHIYTVIQMNFMFISSIRLLF